MEKFKYNTIDEAIAAIKAGQMVLVTDDEDRENEGDLIMAAELCTPEAINFMAKEARGLICMPADSEVMDKLQFGAMVTHNTDNHETAFSVSIDHVDTTTGISAYERAYTMKKCAEPGAQPSDFRRPGHVFPLRARKGGVLVRTGHTETTVDLCKLAGLQPIGICCEIMNDDGHMARTPDLIEFAKKHKLVFITVAELVAYRKAHEKMVHRAAEAALPTKYGNFRIIAYENDLDNLCHVAIVKGDVAGKNDVLVRVHSECLTGDAFGSLRCDCGEQLRRGVAAINDQGGGILLYLSQEGRGIGLANKLRAYGLQDEGLDTIDADQVIGFSKDERDFRVAHEMLDQLGVQKVLLLTNNPSKVEALQHAGINVVARQAIYGEVTTQNQRYLHTKASRHGHWLHELLTEQDEPASTEPERLPAPGATTHP